MSEVNVSEVVRLKTRTKLWNRETGEPTYRKQVESADATKTSTNISIQTEYRDGSETKSVRFALDLALKIDEHFELYGSTYCDGEMILSMHVFFQFFDYFADFKKSEAGLPYKADLEALFTLTQADRDDIMTRMDHSIANKRLSSDLIPYMLKPGAFIVCQERTPSGTVYTSHMVSFCEAVATGYKIYRKSTTQGLDGNRILAEPLQIRSWQGSRSFADLKAIPLRFHLREAELRKEMIERGQNIRALQGTHHRHYKGWFRKIDAIDSAKYVWSFYDGAVMIDLLGYTRRFPAGYVSTVDNDLGELEKDQDLLCNPFLKGICLDGLVYGEFNASNITKLSKSDDDSPRLSVGDSHQELLQLVEAFKSSDSNRGLNLLIRGESGCGKSTLVRSAVRDAALPLYIIRLNSALPELWILDDIRRCSGVLLIDDLDILLNNNQAHRTIERLVEQNDGLLFCTAVKFSANSKSIERILQRINRVYKINFIPNDSSMLYSSVFEGRSNVPSFKEYGVGSRDAHAAISRAKLARLLAKDLTSGGKLSRQNLSLWSAFKEGILDIEGESYLM